MREDVKAYTVYLTEDEAEKIKIMTTQRRTHIALQRALLDFIDNHEVRHG